MCMNYNKRERRKRKKRDNFIPLYRLVVMSINKILHKNLCFHYFNTLKISFCSVFVRFKSIWWWSES